jgi:hypothetical protein
MGCTREEETQRDRERERRRRGGGALDLETKPSPSPFLAGRCPNVWKRGRLDKPPFLENVPFEH